MRVIGLTGGIASGKSTVARMFEALGAVVLYADEIAREVMAPGSPVLEAVREAFGPSVFHADGSLNRAALGDRVFSNPEERRRLETITHPPIRARIRQRLAEAGQPVPAGPPRVVILEHPLLIETSQTDLVEGIILVAAQQSTQVARLTNVKRLTEEQAWARVRSQGTVEQKQPFARWVIDGEAPLDRVRRCVEKIWNELTTAAPAAAEPDDPSRRLLPQ
jgi:dephospho-CoA kinase